jgi:hypothetical protein
MGEGKGEGDDPFLRKPLLNPLLSKEGKGVVLKSHPYSIC